MNNSISEVYKTPPLTSQQKECDQNFSENVRTISSKKNKVFEKFKSIVDSFMKFIRIYIIDKPKFFFKSCFTNKEELLRSDKNIEESFALIKKYCDELSKRTFYNKTACFYALIKKCHDESIPYKTSSKLCPQGVSEKEKTTLTHFLKINNTCHFSSSIATGIPKELMEPIYDLEPGFLLQYKIRKKMFLDDIPSYVGKVENEKYKFLEGKNLHEMMDKIQSVDIEYDGKNHNLCRAQGVVRADLPSRDLYCLLYATKEEAEKAISTSKEEPLKSDLNSDNIEGFHKLMKQCHDEEIPYTTYSCLSPTRVPEEKETTSRFLKINSTGNFLSSRTLISKEFMESISGYELGCEHRITNKMYSEDIPSYVGTVSNATYKFLEGQSLHEMMDKIQSVHIEYDGEKHNLCRVQGIVSDDLPSRDLYCVLYATKEEADKAISTSKEEALKSDLKSDNIEGFYTLIQECHAKNIPYKTYSYLSPTTVSEEKETTSRFLKINNTSDFLIRETGISKEFMRSIPDYELGYEHRTKNKMYSDNIPSYVGKVANAKYKFIEGQSLHEMMSRVQSVYIEYDGKKHHLYRVQGVDLHKQKLYCSLYATKEEADKEISTSKEEPLKSDNNMEGFHTLIKKCHEIRMSYKIYSYLSPTTVSEEQEATSRFLKINNTSDFLRLKMSQSFMESISGYELGCEHRTKNKMFPDYIPSYVGTVENEQYKFLEGKNLHEMRDKIQSVEIKYDSKKYNLCRAHGIDLPSREAYGLLYATKEEADKAIQESNKLLKAVTE